MLLHLSTISRSAAEDLSQSFGNLPETEHLDGKYRLRRYSVISCDEESCDKLKDQTFFQSEDLNKFQGGMVRKFEPIEDSVINSNGLLEIYNRFREIAGFPLGQKVDVHQMRVITQEEETQVSPEGVHQDGYDYICIVGINRHNITGGHFLGYGNKDEEPFLSLPLEAGTMVVVNDRQLWHNASTIKSRYPIGHEAGFLDSFILTMRFDT